MSPLSKQCGFVAAVYFGQGIVPGLSLTALSDHLTAAGVPLAGIASLAFWIGIPWSLSFVWGPAIDNFHLPRLPRRAGWIAAMAVAGGATLLAMTAIGSPVQQLALVATGFTVHSIFASIIDASTDALVVEMTPEDQIPKVHAWGRGGFLSGIGGGSFLFAAMLPSWGYTMTILVAAGLWTVCFAIAAGWYRSEWESFDAATSDPDADHGGGADPQYFAMLIRRLGSMQSLATAAVMIVAYAVYKYFELRSNFAINTAGVMNTPDFSKLRSGVAFVVSVAMIFVASAVLVRTTLSTQSLITVAVAAVAIGACVLITRGQIDGPRIWVYAAAMAVLRLLMYLTACRHFATLSHPLTAGAQFTAYMASLNLAEVAVAGWLAR